MLLNSMQNSALVGSLGFSDRRQAPMTQNEARGDYSLLDRMTDEDIGAFVC